MSIHPEPSEEKEKPPAKPGGLELILIVVFLLFVAWGSYEFGIWIVKDASKASQEIEPGN
ncbi:MAG: hypothetical protein VW455_01890 [Nitrospinota bacterium]